MNVLAPEEIELSKKRKVLERLKDRLADSEEEMTDLRAELEQFEAQYTMEVGRLYAELDEIEAQIAEEEVKLVPDDEEIKKRAEELRKRAEESAANAEGEWENCSHKWQPTVEAKKAYHNLARIIHPDLALDKDEKERRHDLMAQLNDAYSAGNQNLLNKLVEDFRDSPDLIKGDTDRRRAGARDSADLADKKSFEGIARRKTCRRISELFVLHEKVRAEMLEGRNLLKQMAGRTKTQILKAERRLTTLQNLNKRRKNTSKTASEWIFRLSDR